MDYREELAFFSQLLEQKGFVNALEGNISLCDRENGRIYITPSQHMKLRLAPQTVCVLDMDGNQLSGKFPRTSEFFLHQAIYRSCPTKSAVIHSHCPYLTAYALLERDFVLPEKAAAAQGIFAPCMPALREGWHARGPSGHRPGASGKPRVPARRARRGERSRHAGKCGRLPGSCRGLCADAVSCAAVSRLHTVIWRKAS